MNEIERRMLRRLKGELSAEESRQLDRRLAEDPGAAETFAGLRATWERLESPPLERRDDALTRRVVAAAEAEGQRGGGSMVLLPRFAAACALVLGTWIGLSLQPSLHPSIVPEATVVATHPADSGSSAPGLSGAVVDENVGETRGFDPAGLDSSGFDSGGLDIDASWLGDETEVSASTFDIDAGVFEELSAEELFATTPTLAESFWLGDTDPVFGHSLPNLDAGGTS